MSKAQDRAEAADLLDRAARMIEERGHWKGNYTGPAGEVCAIGALSLYVLSHGRRVVEASMRSLRSHLGVPVAAWNDAHTSEEVCAGMRACAADLRA